MAHVRCPGCGGYVEHAVMACPACGELAPGHRVWMTGCLLTILVAVIVSVLGIGVSVFPSVFNFLADTAAHDVQIENKIKKAYPPPDAEPPPKPKPPRDD